MSLATDVVHFSLAVRVFDSSCSRSWGHSIKNFGRFHVPDSPVTMRPGELGMVCRTKGLPAWVLEKKQSRQNQGLTFAQFCLRLTTRKSRANLTRFRILWWSVTLRRCGPRSESTDDDPRISALISVSFSMSIVLDIVFEGLKGCKVVVQGVSKRRVVRYGVFVVAPVSPPENRARVLIPKSSATSTSFTPPQSAEKLSMDFLKSGSSTSVSPSGT